MADPYSDPETGVLVNTLGLTAQPELERVERDLTSFALLRLRDRPLPGGYDLTHLQGFHRARPPAGALFRGGARYSGRGAWAVMATTP